MIVLLVATVTPCASGLTEGWFSLYSKVSCMTDVCFDLSTLTLQEVRDISRLSKC